MDLGRQVGVENRSKIDAKKHRKSDEKKKDAKKAKKSQQEAPATPEYSVPGSWGGGRGRGKPLHRGLKPEGLKEEWLKTDIPL